MESLKALFETSALSEEMKAEILEAWDAKVIENRQQVTAELREEFAQKYEHDKGQMVEAVNKMVSEGLTSEIAEFKEDRKQLAEAKAKYAVAMRENVDLMKDFVVQQLSEEIAELRADKNKLSENFSKLEEFVVESLASEIAEFYEDKKDLAETKVKLVKEARTKFDDVKRQFIKRGAEAISETVSKTLKTEFNQLREDIEEARKNDFGRRLFESYANEYQHSFLNEKSEASKLLKVIELKDKQLLEAKAETDAKAKLIESKELEIKRIAETSQRQKALSELLSPLSSKQREIMSELLESVQTSKLPSAFEKYLPTVINNEGASVKKQLTESTEVTGNRETKTTKADDSNVLDIRRLAGLN